MATTPQDLFQRAASEVEGFFRDGVESLKDTGSDALRGLDDLTPIPELARAAARGVCRLYGANPLPIVGPVAAGLERACRPYLDDLGGSPAGVELPFRGGQCPVAYTVFATSQGTDLSIGGATPLSINGPLSAPTQTSVLVGSPFPDSTRYEFRFPSDPTKVLNFTARAGFNPSPGFRVAGRVDGQPDNCGNPEPVVIPPTPIPNPGPFPFPFNPSPDIDIDIDIDIGPDGDINIDFGTGPITIDPFGGGGGGGGGGVEPGDIGSPGSGGSTGEGGEAEGEAPPNSVLVGLKITIVSAPEFGSEYDPDVRRGVCYAYMGTPGNLALEPSGVALRSGQFLFAQTDFLTAWRVSANVGYNLNVVPYYRALEAQEV